MYSGPYRQRQQMQQKISRQASYRVQSTTVKVNGHQNTFTLSTHTHTPQEVYAGAYWPLKPMHTTIGSRKSEGPSYVSLSRATGLARPTSHKEEEAAKEGKHEKQQREKEISKASVSKNPANPLAVHGSAGP